MSVRYLFTTRRYAGRSRCGRVSSSSAPSSPTGPAGTDNLYGGAPAPAVKSPLEGGLKGYLASVEGGGTHARAAALAPRREAPSPRGSVVDGVSPETLQALELYAAEPVPEETGLARAKLEERAKGIELVDRVKRSDGVSRETGSGD